MRSYSASACSRRSALKVSASLFASSTSERASLRASEITFLYSASASAARLFASSASARAWRIVPCRSSMTLLSGGMTQRLNTKSTMRKATSSTKKVPLGTRKLDEASTAYLALGEDEDEQGRERG